MFIVKQRNIPSFNNSINNKMSVNNDKIKINRFDVYHKDCNELNIGLIQMKIYFEFNEISNDKKTLFAIIYLRERVQHGMQSKLIDYLNNSKKDKNDEFDFFELFEKELRKIFDVFNKEQTAKQIIQHMTQQISTLNYVVKFQKHINLIK